MNKVLKRRLELLEKYAKELKIDYFPIQWEILSEEALIDVIAYSGIPQPRHWHFGQSYEYQKASAEMGTSKVYEIVVNSNPAVAYLLDSNTDVANSLVMAHVIGHSACFKTNFLFKKTDRQIITNSAARAARVDQYIEKYGIEQVEHIMDIGYALDKNINWDKGLYRELYPKTKKELIKRQINEFDDLNGKANNPIYETKIKNSSFPPEKEYDLLWFLINYSELEDWQKDVLQIIRESSFYFYPQYHTKILNEGIASFIQIELCSLLPESEFSQAEYLEFSKLHSSVVQPGHDKLNINPYFLGFTILSDIRKRWDELHSNGNSSITGFQKVLEVVSEEDDISFIRNYLTQDLVDELQLFAYVKKYDKQQEAYLEVISKNLEDVIEHLISKLYNYRAPVISIVQANNDGLELEHETPEIGTLDLKHTEKVMEYLYYAWGGIVDLRTFSRSGESFHYTYDEEGFSHRDDDDNDIN